MKFFASLALPLAAAISAQAITIKFVNQCDYTIWASVGSAPWGSPDPSIAYGKELHANGGSDSYTVSDTAVGVRAWGRTGCDSTGSNCKTGACVGGLVCTDGGINSGVVLSEYGYADFGANYGGERTSWDLSRVDLDINIPTRLVVSDGQEVFCKSDSDSGCPASEAYSTSTDYAADRNSPLGQTYTHYFCP
ncbi:unnamed protein product [Peniophora sp. CBMAI 1063]|nr:unnamed protein product [Peniophora sp. CBMAI 1063]